MDLHLDSKDLLLAFIVLHKSSPVSIMVIATTPLIVLHIVFTMSAGPILNLTRPIASPLEIILFPTKDTLPLAYVAQYTRCRKPVRYFIGVMLLLHIQGISDYH